MRCKPGQMAIVTEIGGALNPKDKHWKGRVVTCVRLTNEVPSWVLGHERFWEVEEARSVRFKDDILLPINDPDLEQEIKNEVLKEEQSRLPAPAEHA